MNQDNRIDIITIIIALLSTIFGLIFSFLFPETQILVLTILTVLLPVIYQIGNILSKESIRDENKRDSNILGESLEELKTENENLKEKLINP